MHGDCRRVVALLLVMIGWLAAGPAWAEGFGKPFRFSVTGEGVVRAVPDLAHVAIAVHTREKTAAAALRANTLAMRKVFDTLKKRFGIAGKDMMTSGLSVSPVYFTPRDVKGRPNGAPKLVAYRVSNRLQVTVRDLKVLGALLDAVVADGANRVDGIVFDLSDRARLLDEARRRAVADAKARAKLYAQAVGFVLGPVVDVREEGGQVAPMRGMRFARMAAPPAAAEVPLARGEQQVRASVTITWQALSR